MNEGWPLYATILNDLVKASDRVVSLDDKHNNATYGTKQRQLINIPLEDSRLPVVLRTNINLISNNLGELFVLTRSCLPSIALVETFLDASTPDDAVTISNYTVTRRDRCWWWLTIIYCE